MPHDSNRVNVILDAEHATKLRRLAERAHVNPGTLARSLLSIAIEESDPDAHTITELLDSIDGAHDRAQRGLSESRAGAGIPLEDF